MRRSYPWASILALVQRYPNRWVLPLDLIGVPVRVAKAVRLQQVQQLRRLDGTLECAKVNVDPAGKRCDLYLRWRPDDDAVL